jgi:hypothetical protein
VSSDLCKKERDANAKRKTNVSSAERNREKNLRQAVAKLEAENSALALENGKMKTTERDSRTRLSKAVAENTDLVVELTNAQFGLQSTERRIEELDTLLDCAERKLAAMTDTIDLRSEDDGHERGRSKSARKGRARHQSAPPPQAPEPPPRSDPPFNDLDWMHGSGDNPPRPTWGKPDRKPPTPELDAWGTLRPQPRGANDDRRPHKHVTPGWEGYVPPAKNPKSEASQDSDSGSSDDSEGGAQKRQRFIEEQGKAIAEFNAKVQPKGTHLRFKSPAKTSDAGSSSTPSSPAGSPPSRACPICVEGSGKAEGHRGRHRRAARTGN